MRCVWSCSRVPIASAQRRHEIRPRLLDVSDEEPLFFSDWSTAAACLAVPPSSDSAALLCVKPLLHRRKLDELEHCLKSFTAKSNRHLASIDDILKHAKFHNCSFCSFLM